MSTSEAEDHEDSLIEALEDDDVDRVGFLLDRLGIEEAETGTLEPYVQDEIQSMYERGEEVPSPVERQVQEWEEQAGMKAEYSYVVYYQATE